jgi:hypothetical protein
VAEDGGDFEKAYEDNRASRDLSKETETSNQVWK